MNRLWAIFILVVALVLSWSFFAYTGTETFTWQKFHGNDVAGDHSAAPTIKFGTVGIWEGSTGVINVSDYTREIDIPASAAQLGPNAPTATTTGTARGQGCDADNEQLFIAFEVPGDWDGASDMVVEIYWSAEAGDAVANTEKVIWDFEYRTIHHTVLGTEAIDNGSSVEITDTHTQSGGGLDKGAYEAQMTLDYNHADQTLAAGDVVYAVINRDVTTEAGDSYSGLAILTKIEIIYTSNAFPTH